MLCCEGAGAPELEGPPEPDIDATIADASPVAFRLGDACAGVDVEPRRHSRRLRPLAVEEMLSESESRTRSGERNRDSGAGVGLLTAMVKARAWFGIDTEDVGDDWYTGVPVMESAGGTISRLRPMSFTVGVRGSAAWGAS